MFLSPLNYFGSARYGTQGFTYLRKISSHHLALFVSSFSNLQSSCLESKSRALMCMLTQQLCD